MPGAGHGHPVLARQGLIAKSDCQGAVGATCQAVKQWVPRQRLIRVDHPSAAVTPPIVRAKPCGVSEEERPHLRHRAARRRPEARTPLARVMPAAFELF